MGSKLVAFEYDGEATHNDRSDEDVPQSLYIMDDSHTILNLWQEENSVDYVVRKTYSFAHHKKKKELVDLQE